METPTDPKFLIPDGTIGKDPNRNLPRRTKPVRIIGISLQLLKTLSTTCYKYQGPCSNPLVRYGTRELVKPLFYVILCIKCSTIIQRGRRTSWSSGVPRLSTSGPRSKFCEGFDSGWDIWVCSVDGCGTFLAPNITS